MHHSIYMNDRYLFDLNKDYNLKEVLDSLKLLSKNADMNFHIIAQLNIPVDENFNEVNVTKLAKKLNVKGVGE